MSGFTLCKSVSVPADDWEIQRLVPDGAATGALADLLTAVDAALVSGALDDLEAARSRFDAQTKGPIGHLAD